MKILSCAASQIATESAGIYNLSKMFIMWLAERVKLTLLLNSKKRNNNFQKCLTGAHRPAYVQKIKQFSEMLNGRSPVPPKNKISKLLFLFLFPFIFFTSSYGYVFPAINSTVNYNSQNYYVIGTATNNTYFSGGNAFSQVNPIYITHDNSYSTLMDGTFYLSYYYDAMQLTRVATDSYNQMNYFVFYGLTPLPPCTGQQVRDSSGVCQTPCGTSMYRDSTGTCVFDMSTIPFEKNGDSYEYHFPDHTSEYCSLSTNNCVSIGADGKVIPNIPINGVTYAAPGDLTAHKLAVLGGVAVAIGSGGLSLLAESPLIAMIGASTGLHSLAYLGASAFTGDIPFNMNNLNSSNASSTADVKMANLANLSTPATVSITTTSTGATLQTANYPTGTWDALESSPSSGTTSVANVSPDGSATVVTVPTSVLIPASTNDLSSSNNLPATSYEVATIPAPTINPNGTVSQTPTYSGYDFNPNTNISTPTYTSLRSSQYPDGSQLVGTVVSSVQSSSFGNGGTTSVTTSKSTTTTDGNGTTVTSGSTTSDLSAVTNRLDQLINQGTVKGSTTLDDGTSGLGGVQTTLTNSLGVTSNQGDILGLNTGQYQLQQYSFSILGHTFVIFDPSWMNNIPVADIRNLFLMVAAIAGFLTIFRGI